MSTFSKHPLSQSAYGSPIILSLSSTPGNLIHETSPLSAITDEIWLYTSNTTTSDVIVSVFLGSSAMQNFIGQTVIEAYSGPTLLFPGLILTGNNTQSSKIYCNCSSLSAATIFGYINRIQ
jgi:hypothetical protein